MIPGIMAGAMGQGGPPTPPGDFDPSILSGLTFAMSANDSAIYKDGSTSAGLADADGDLARRIDSLESINRTFYSVGSPTLELAEFGPLLPAIDSNATQGWLLYQKPAGTGTPTASETADALFNADAKLLIWAGTVESATANTGNTYGNNKILSDALGYVGLHCYQAGDDIVYQWYNWSGGDVSQNITVAAGTPLVIACRHDGGNLRMARDGVTWSSPTASGNTDSVGGEMNLGGAVSGFHFKTAALVTCDTANSDADILTVVKEMGALVGLSL